MPYSKEYWFTNDGESEPKMEIKEPGGHDLNEQTTLVWFQNNFKKATKYPLNRFDGTTGGGNIYSYGSEVTHDDYNFTKFVSRLRAIYKDIVLKPTGIQLMLEFPELEKNEFFINDLDIIFYGHSEIEKAKELANMQAKAAIANDLMNNFKRDAEHPVFHWRYVAKHIMELTDEQLQENEKYWQEDAKSGSTTGGAQGAAPAEEGTPAPAQGEAPVQGEAGTQGAPPAQGGGQVPQETPPAA